LLEFRRNVRKAYGVNGVGGKDYTFLKECIFGIGDGGCLSKYRSAKACIRHPSITASKKTNGERSAGKRRMVNSIRAKETVDSPISSCKAKSLVKLKKGAL